MGAFDAPPFRPGDVPIRPLRLCTPALTSQVTVLAGLPSEGQRFLSGALYFPLHRRLLRTIRPPPPAVATELQWGELCQEPLAPAHALLGRNAQLASPAALFGQPLILVVYGQSIPIWHHCGYQLEQRNVGQGRSDKPFCRCRLAVVSVSDAPYGELPYLFSIYNYSKFFSYHQDQVII